MRLPIQSYARISALAALTLLMAGCATSSLTPGSIQPPDPAVSYNAIEAEPTYPPQVAVVDFNVTPSAVTENRSLLHRAIDLFRRSTADQRRMAIGRRAAKTLAEQTAKRLDKTGLNAARFANDDDPALRGNFLLVSGRMTQVNEGNRFTRIAFGLGLGESHLATEVHVFRVVNGEKAEVLGMTTHANSGKMPGVALSIGFGEFFLGPITLFTAIEDAVSSGQKIYVSQVDYLAAETGNQLAAYLSQYAAAEKWIARDKARRVHYAS